MLEIEALEIPKIDWEYLGKYFNVCGSLVVKKNQLKGNLISITFEGQDQKLFDEIKKFLKYGNIKKRTDAKSYVFRSCSRKEILDFILNTYPYAPLRRELIDFLIISYAWSTGAENNEFDFNRLAIIIEKWKLTVRKEELLRLKAIRDSGEQANETTNDTTNQEDESEGGEEDD